MNEGLWIGSVITRLAMSEPFSQENCLEPLRRCLSSVVFCVSFLALLRCNGVGQDWLAVPIAAGIQNPSAKVEQAQKLLKSQRYDLAVQLLREAVDSDRDPDAQYLLGWCYANGRGVTRSLLQAEQSFFGAAQRKQVAGLYSLGRLRVSTAQPGNSKRVTSGIDSLKQAAEQGMGAAMRRLGIIYRTGHPGSLNPDLDEALRWFKRAGAAGDPESLFYQAAMLDDKDSGKKSSAQALALYNQAAASGSASAMLHLGFLALDKPNPDRRMAIGWYEKAATLHSAEANYRLGLLLGEEDPAKAFKQFRVAADYGHGGALAHLGIAFEEGRGTAKSVVDAVAAYQKSAERRDPLGLYRLAICYEHGFGIAKNQKLATENFQLSGQAGYVDAQHRMGRRYVTGEGTTKDLIAAAAWFQLGADQGHAPCQSDLGKVYETAGVMRDPAKALDLYRKAAAQGDAEAWFRLGRMFETGSATPVKLEVAYHLYFGATEKGYTAAKPVAASVARRLASSVVKAIKARYKADPKKVPGQQL